ncbi:MAG TPA: GTPase [Cyanothece sp. UBA12306]|nr:GTPase [Cyanothece sp. UBA12306]
MESQKEDSLTSPVRKPSKIVIMGAAGRDFHNFNQVYRQDPTVEVVAFTAAQISGIANRRYPAKLAGSLYREGIPIVEETELESLCRRESIDCVVFAYSDLTHGEVMHLASRAMVAGSDFLLLGPQRTMLSAQVPVIAVSAVRTGCGKSQTTRWLSKLLRQKGLRVGVIRHPMPYGDLEKQIVQRFASKADLDMAQCTIEEREEYEPHLEAGNIVYAGVDYGLIVQQAEQEADIILWDGGNNDFPLIKPDLHLVLVDPLRPGNETTHHPGEVVLRMADIAIIAKTDAAADADIQKVRDTVKKVNPKAIIVRGASPIELDSPEAVRDRRVLVVEDGPTTTHGGMPYGAGYVAATRAQAATIVDPRTYAVPEIAAVYASYPHIGPILPAMGYFPAQLKALETTINNADVDVVVAATPSNLSSLMQLNKPVVRAHYEFAEVGEPSLSSQIEQFLALQNLGGCS